MTTHQTGTTLASEKLQASGLRLTKQRLALINLLFSRGDRHLTAEMLHIEALRANVDVALATVYNTLHQFTRSGILRVVTIEGKAFFDTNASDHHHFFIEDEARMIDVCDESVAVLKLPQPPEDYAIAGYNIVFHLKKCR